MAKEQTISEPLLQSYHLGIEIQIIGLPLQIKLLLQSYHLGIEMIQNKKILVLTLHSNRTI